MQAVKDGIRRPAVVLATGGGKTVVLASLIPKLTFDDPRKRKILVLAHKEELVRQLHATISRMNPQLNVQIDMQKSIPTADADVIIGSVMTLVRLTRLHRYDPLEFGAIVLDECHHAVANSWTKILNFFGALDEKSKMLILGFTATLERADGKKLEDVFEAIVFERSLRTMVEKKELCDIKFSTIKTDVNFTNVRMNMGDYVTSLLSKEVNVDEVNLQVTRAYIQLRRDIGFKSTLIFCVDIDHCKTLCGVFQENGINAQYVTGETVKYERQAILEDFKNGNLDVLCNVLVFTEGTDIPNIDSLILARPTRSRPLLVQMIGRGLRLHRGKLYCHVIDIVSTVGIGVLSVPTLFGLDPLVNFEGKTLLEMEKEVDESNKKSDSALLSEVNATFEIQQRLKDLDLEIDTIDGFAELEKEGEKSAQSIKATNRAFKERGKDYVRLEYNTWALPIPFANYFYTIERILDEDNKVQGFNLYKLTYASRAMIIASNFKSKRILDSIVTSGSLDHCLSVASNNAGRSRNMKGSGKENISRPITENQSTWLLQKFSKKITNEHGVSGLSQFETGISKMTSQEASDFIFALKYSMSSLFVQWQIKRMIQCKKKPK